LTPPKHPLSPAAALNNPLLIRLVLDELRKRRSTRSPARHGISRETLEEAVETFVEAGSRAVTAALVSPRWVSWGLALPRKKRPRFARELRAALRLWIAAGHATRFYFMQKPPGIRLRIESGQPDLTRTVVERWLRARMWLHPAREVVYEPESYQFGGAVGMDIAHTHFHSDSLAALQIMEWEGLGKLTAGKEVLASLCTFDLARRASSDPWEMWDLWRGLELTGRLADAPESTVAVCARTVEPWLRRKRECLAALTAHERALVQTYGRANARPVRALRAAADRRRLLFTPRQVLPFWIVFDWNRWGLRSESQSLIAIGAERLLSPKG
jgi:thiopeptide-type bacteriocin biosynthesis protein